MTAILELRSVNKRFGAVVVADGLDLAVARGETLGVLGPNGAGKTSLFNMVTGALAPDSGCIVFDGANITSTTPAQRCRLGIGRSFQIPQPFSGLTVFENLLVPAQFARTQSVRLAERDCLEVLELCGLLPRANALAGSLTLLERKRLELARALAGRPRLLLLDEIAGGLTSHECDELLVGIAQIRRTGVTIVWIEHVVQALLAAADRLVVLSEGAKIAEGEPESVMRSRVVQDIYLGAHVDD